MLEMENSMGQIKHTKEYITNRLDKAGETISGTGKRLRKYDTKIPVRERKSNISKLWNIIQRPNLRTHGMEGAEGKNKETLNSYNVVMKHPPQGSSCV